MSFATFKSIPLGELVNFEGGGTPSKAIADYWNGDIPWASVKDITGLELSRTTDSITIEGLRNSASRIVPKGNVIIPTRMALGRAAINTIDVAINQDLRVAYPNGNLDRRFLLWFIIANAQLIESLGSGATVKGITLEKLRELPVPLPHKNGKPDLDEQKRIAAILDKADAIRRKRQQALRLTDDFLRSVFLDMFGERKAKTISVRELLNNGQLLLHKDGNHGSQYPRAHEFGDEGIAFLSANCIDERGSIVGEKAKYLEESKANSLKIGWIEKGDVLLAHNATVGPVAVYDGGFGRCLIGTSLTAYRPSPDAFTSEFLAEALRADAFQSQLVKSMSQTTRNQVPITAQRDFLLPIPPIGEQRKFASVCRKAAEIQARQLASSKADIVAFASLQQRAFRGEL